MPHARLTVALPESVWIGRLSRRFPETTFEVLAAHPDGEAGVALVEIGGDDPLAVLSELEATESVVEAEPLEMGEDSTLVRFRTTDPPLLLSARASGMPLEMPIPVRDGEATIDLVAPRERLSALGDQLTAFDLPYTVEFVHPTTDSSGALTDRQRRLVTAAVDHGYYDTPRTCTLTELADAEGVAKSTVSETLHRAEGAIVKRFVAEELSADPFDSAADRSESD